MVDVLLVGLKQRPSPDRTAADRQQGVHDRQPQRDGRDQHGDGGGGLLVRLHGGGRQDEAQEHAAGVAHEDRRRVEVVEQKPDDRSGQRRREQHHQRVTALERNEKGRDDGDQRHAAGQAVEAVDQVHGVGDADDPEHGEGEVRPAERDRLAKRVRQGVEPEPHPVHEERHRELDREFLGRVRAAQVVVEAQERDGDPAHEQADHMLALGDEQVPDAAVEQQRGR